MRLQLSKRMQAVADMAEPGFVTADVGCDHGFISIYLAREGICPYVYAADVRPGPLLRAKRHIREAGLEDCIEPVLSDGLKEVPEDVEAMLAAGIGGRLTIHILEGCPVKTRRLSWLALAPQSEAWLVRGWLRENRFFITREEILQEDGKYYPICKALNEDRVDRNEEIASKKAELLRVYRKWAQKETAGYTLTNWEKACELYGVIPFFTQYERLWVYLTDCIKKDGELLEKLQGRSEKASLRCQELKERIMLAGLAKDFLEIL